MADGGIIRGGLDIVTDQKNNKPKAEQETAQPTAARFNYVKRSFCHSGARLWNNLPQDLESVCSTGQFKRGIVRSYLRYRIPTRQSFKIVVMSFSFLSFSLTDDSPCLNKDLHYITWNYLRGALPKVFNYIS